MPAFGGTKPTCRPVRLWDAIERISELLPPGSSIIVSDNKLSDETGEYTEFIVLTP